MRLRKIEPERIPALVAQGLSAAEIAVKLGCAEGSLRVRCSQLKISLKRQGNAKPDARTANVGPASCAPVDRNPVAKRADPPEKAVANHETELCVALPHKTMHQLRQHAALMGISGAMLAANLLQTIAQDGLYKAVLDTG